MEPGADTNSEPPSPGLSLSGFARGRGVFS